MNWIEVGVGKVMSALLYFSAWLQMMWTGCTYNEDNMNQCMKDWNIWLYPEIEKGVEMLTNPCPYCDEQNAVQERRDLQVD